MFFSKSLQNRFLNNLIFHRKTVWIYLKNGVRLKGVITGQTDTFLFLWDGMTQMIQKQAITQVIPVESQHSITMKEKAMQTPAPECVA